MRKQMKRAISFLLAVTLLAGNSYVDMGVNGAATVTMSDWVEVDPEETTPDTSAKNASWFDALQERYSSVTNFFEKKVRSAFAANENEWRYVLRIVGGDTIENGGSVPAVMNQGTGQVAVTRIGPSNKTDSIVDFSCTFESRHPETIEIVTDQTDPKNTMLIAKKPGWGMLHIVITGKLADGSTKVEDFYATFLVRAELKTSDKEYWKYSDVMKETVLVLDPAKMDKDTYQLEFIGINDKDSSKADLISESIEFSEKPSPSVATIDDDGLLTITGAGITSLKISNYADISVDNGEENRVTAGDPYTIKIIVLPTGGYKVNKDEYKAEENVHITEADQPADEFVLYTNAYAASSLTWKMYEVKQNKSRVLIDPETTKLFDYTYEENNIRFSNVKAGTYCFEAYTAEEYSDIIRCLKFNVVVDLIMDTSKIIYMNVDDTYNIIQNSNIPEGMFNKLFSTLPVEEDGTAIEGTPIVATMNNTTGVVTAHRYGTQRYKVTYAPLNEADGIFSDAIAENLEKKPWNYTFEVIDKLSLNYSSLVMVVGQKTQLIPNQTQAGSVSWYVSQEDTKYVEVDKNGLLIAKSVTPKNYFATVTVTQIIDGVTKSANCKITVQQSVSEIKLSPSEIEVEIGGVRSVEAVLLPTGLASYNISWASSDPKIFKCEPTSPTTVQITGVSAGTATLTAINTENTVVGYCVVTVKMAGTAITLSQKEVTGYIRESHHIYATVTPDTATNKEVSWRSTKPEIVSVQDGKLTFHKAGTATIIVTLDDNPAVYAECHVTVLQTIGSLDLDEKKIEMYTGESKRLTYSISPNTTSDKSVEWTSFDTKVVAVDKEGKLTAKGPGTTQVMVMSLKDPSCYDLCTITVKQAATGVKVNYSTVTMNVGEYFDMEVTVTPVNSTEVSLIWESLDPKIVTVSSNGRLTGRSVGDAIVLVRTLNGVSSYCKVTVLEPVDDMEVDPGEVTIDVGEVFKLEPVFKPAKPSNEAVKWTSTDNSIVKVNVLGEIEGIAKGTAVIICESVDGGYRSFCLVTVEDPDMVVSINPTTYRLGINKSYTLEAVVTSGKGTKDVDLEWSSSNTDVCIVDQYGKITGLDYGYATIRVEVEDSYGAYAECEVRVVREVTSVKLNHNYLEIIQGKTASLKATIQPSNATYLDALFTSSDESIAMVDDDGLVTALKPGTTTIRADAKDNSGKYAICHVTVIAPISATGITVSDKEIVLVPGEKKQITTAMKPNNSTDGMTWSSNNEVIATVNGSGTISAHNTGTATITVMTDSGKIATVDVIVLGLSRTTLEIPLYTQYSKLTVDGATGTVRWDVQDTTICEVRNGVITARKVGTTKVTATINGRTLTCTVKVVPNKKK